MHELNRECERLRIVVHGTEVNISESNAAFVGKIATADLILTCFGNGLMDTGGENGEFARVKSLAQTCETRVLNIIATECFTPNMQPFIETVLKQRKQRFDDATTNKAKLAALETDGNFSKIIESLTSDVGVAVAGLYARGTDGTKNLPTKSKVGLGGTGQTGTVHSRASHSSQGGGNAMVILSAPKWLHQEQPTSDKAVESNLLRAMCLEGIEALTSLICGGFKVMHGVGMSGSPKNDPVEAADASNRKQKLNPQKFKTDRSEAGTH